MDDVERTRIWIEAAASVKTQKFLWQECKDDIVFWVEAFCHTYDPRSANPVIPFDLYPFQKWALPLWHEHLVYQEDFLVEKSRDMGVTWMVLLLCQHGWLFHGWDFLLGSRKEDYVDTIGDMSTHFPKLRYNLYRLPEWMRPEGFNPKVHDNYMKLINPKSNNSITGESSNPSFARGGRYRAIVFDEFAFWDNAEAAWVSASQSTRCRIPISTPNGKANKFAELALSKDNELKEYHD